MKTIKTIANIIINLAIISSMIVGVWAFVSTPTASDIEVKEIAHSIEQMEKKSLEDYDPTTFEVVWVSENYDNCLVRLPDGNVHKWVVYEAYDNIVVLEMVDGTLHEYHYHN